MWWLILSKVQLDMVETAKYRRYGWWITGCLDLADSKKDKNSEWGVGYRLGESTAIHALSHL